MIMAKFSFAVALYLAGVIASPDSQGSKSSCAACSPPGFKSVASPNFGPDLGAMYSDLVQSVQGIHFSRRSVVDDVEKRAAPPICCASGTQCVLMAQLAIPFCYDKFTTNYYLPDGSYGTISTGDYHSGNQEVNLLNGTISSGGNIYSDNAGEQPNTATLSVPAQYTGTGVGGPIPVTRLGTGSLEVSVVKGPTTIQPITIEGTTLVKTTQAGSVVSATTIPGTTIPGTTVTGTASVTLEASSTSSSSTKKSEATGSNINLLIGQTVCALLAVVFGFTIMF